MIESRTLLIDPPHLPATTNFPEINKGGKIYSKYGLGLWLVFVPQVCVGKTLAYFIQVEERVLIDCLVSLTSPLFGILGLIFFRKILSNLGASSIKSNFALITLGISSFYWKYSTIDFSAIMQACSLLGVFYYFSSSKSGRLLFVSFWISFLISIKVIYVIFIPIFTFYTIYINRGLNFHKKISMIFQLYSFVAPMGLILIIYNYFRYQNIFETGYGSESAMFSFQYFKRDFIPYLFSVDRGLLFYNPLLFISLFGYKLIPAKHNIYLLLLVSIVIIWYVLMCFWQSFSGDYAWGNRFLVPILPLIFIPVAFIPTNKKIINVLTFLLILISTLIQFSASFTKVNEITEIQLKLQDSPKHENSSQIMTGLNLFYLKLFTSKAVYSADEFVADNSDVINLSKYESFNGFNIWVVHLLNYLGFSSFTYWAGIVFLSLTILVCLVLYYFCFVKTKFLKSYNLKYCSFCTKI